MPEPIIALKDRKEIKNVGKTIKYGPYSLAY